MLIIIGLLFFCYLVNQGPLRQTKTAAVLIFLAAVFVMGFRSVTYTDDNIAYAEYYLLNSKFTLQESWEQVITWETKDPFYFFLGNVFSKCGFSWRGWFVFIAAIYMSGFCYLMYKESKNFSLSVFFLITLGDFYFAMTGLRQAMALGCCFFAFEFLCQKKVWLFFLLVGIGGLFHSSGWVFFLMYPLNLVPWGTKYMIMAGIAPLIAVLFPGLLGSIVKQVAWNDHLAAYAGATEGLTISGYLINIAFCLVCVWCLWRGSKTEVFADSLKTETKKETETEKRFLLYGMTALIWGATFRAFSININNFFRIATYFSSVTPIMITAVTAKMSLRERSCILGFLMTCWFLSMLFRSRHYEYFSMFETLPGLD